MFRYIDFDSQPVSIAPDARAENPKNDQKNWFEPFQKFEKEMSTLPTFVGKGKKHFPVKSSRTKYPRNRFEIT